MKIRRSTSSPMSSSSAASSSDTAVSCRSRSSGTSSSCLRSIRSVRRKVSIARCFAVAMSQAPGLSGTPDSGHRSSAARRASCARSSARPTSRTIRVSPAISFADSIRQTASIARWVSEVVTTSNHTSFAPPCKGRNTVFTPLLQPFHRIFWLGFCGSLSLCVGGHLLAHVLFVFPELGGELGTKVLALAHLANLDFRLPREKRIWSALYPLDRLVQRFHLKQPEPSDQLLRLSEWPIDHVPLGS